jgi:hypothetical protein
MEADIVRALHVLLVVFIVVAPALNSAPLWALDMWLCVALLFHWFVHENVCCLSVAEAALRGKPLDETFMHSLIAPVYDVCETTLSSVCFSATFASLAVSAWRLWAHMS